VRSDRWPHRTRHEPYSEHVLEDARAAAEEAADELRLLLDQVVSTRAAEHEFRIGKTSDKVHLLPARRACLTALEAYTGALRARGWPVPRQMTQEMVLMRSLCKDPHWG
jgi:hypothetical protein